MSDTVTSKVLDFTDVQDPGGVFSKRRVPAGDYLARITKVVDAPSKKDGIHQWLFTIVLEKHKGNAYPYYCKLAANQLWKLRNLCLAAGINVPKKRVKVDPSKLVGKLIAVSMEDDEYDNKPQSNVAATFPASELQDQVVEPEDDDEYEDEDEEEEEEEEAPPPRKKAVARRKPVPEPEPEEDNEVEGEDEEDDEEEEEEPAPPPRKRVAKKAAPARRPARKTTEVTDDELEELDIDDV